MAYRRYKQRPLMLPRLIVNPFSYTQPSDARQGESLQFDSWAAFIERCESGPSELITYSRFSRRQVSDWNGTDTFEAAVTLARFGWADGTDKAAKLAYPLIDKIAARMHREEYVYETTGITFDVARVLENEPECWLDVEHVEIEAPGRILTLVFNGAVSGAVDSRVITAKGSVIAALIMLLERAGFRVQVDFVDSVDYQRRVHSEIWIPIKTTGQDLDLSRMMFALAHPAMARRMVFAAQETLADNDILTSLRDGGYGTPVEVARERQGDIYIGMTLFPEPQWNSTESATEWILTQLRAQGITVSEESKN